jgi:hypothetical protein
MPLSGNAGSVATRNADANSHYCWAVANGIWHVVDDAARESPVGDSALVSGHGRRLTVIPFCSTKQSPNPAANVPDGRCAVAGYERQPVRGFADPERLTGCGGMTLGAPTRR